MVRSSLLLAVLYGGLGASAQNSFIVHFDDVQAGHAGVGSSIEEVPGGYLCFTRQLSPQFPMTNHVFTRKLNPAGLVELEHEYTVGYEQDHTFGYIDPVDVRDDGTFAVTVTEGYGYEGGKYLYVFADSGDTLSRRFLMRYPMEDSIIHLVRQTRAIENDGYVLVGAFASLNNNSQALLVRVNSVGDTLWTRRYGAADEAAIALGVAEYVDGGYLLTGSALSQGGFNKSFLIRTDVEGNQLWRRNYGNRANVNGAVRVAADGGIVTWSAYREPDWPNWYWQQMMLTKWNQDGGMVWQKRSHYNDYVNTHDLEILPDGSFITTGTSLLEAVLAKFSPTGDSLWSRRYAPTHGGTYLYDVEPTSDGGFIATGETSLYAPVDTGFQTGQLIWVLKTDSLGCVVPGCQHVGVREYALDMNEYLSIWPNPAGEQLSVSFSPPTAHSVQGALRVTVLDALGRQVLAAPLATSPLDVHHLAAGTYYLHLSTGARWLAGRTFVKE